MVWVWPPHTSMNLNSPSPASDEIWATRARADAGSRYSSTNRIVFLGCRVQPGATPGVTSGPLEDTGTTPQEVATEREAPRQQVLDLVGRADDLPRLSELLPALLASPGAQHVADHHS